MRFKLLACKALFRELSYVCSLSENIVDITWIRQGCHDRPEQLKELLQKEINAIEEGDDLHTNKRLEDFSASGVAEDFDAILLGYGLCSNAVTGITAKSHRLVIPKAHDCITLFLGAKERYSHYFQELPGCFWYTASWIENTEMPSQKRTETAIQYYKAMDYDEDMIDYLLTEMGGLNNYHHAAYIDMPYLKNQKYRDFTKAAADFFKWDYHQIEGNLSLFEKLISGNWDPSEFLVLEPGETAAQSFDANILKKVLR